MKSDYYIDRITKKQAQELLLTYHYLKDFSKDFKSGWNYGLFKKNDFSPLNIGHLLGVVIFTGLPVPEIAKGAFGLERNEQKGLFELSRLCIHPDIQSGEHNITSWFVSRAIRQLRKDTEVKAIISYADSDFHNGTIIALVTLSIADSQTQRKISTMHTELNTLEAKLKVLKDNGKIAPASTDM